MRSISSLTAEPIGRLRSAGSEHRDVLANAGSLVATAGTTSLLGAAFWWLAARQFSQHSVGLAGAAVSAMTLLGFAATIGLGTVLIGELPRHRGREHGLINAALLASAGTGALVGAVFATIAPLISSGFDPLRQGWISVLVFAFGVSLTALTLVLDLALIGLLRGGLQLTRNIVFATIKLILLLGVVALSATYSGMGIYAAWALGMLLSLSVLVPFYLRERNSLRPSFGLLNRMRFDAAGHHAFNLALRAPDLLLPIIVLVVLSPALSASFYIAWMIASLLLGIPQALSTALYAVGSTDRVELWRRFRFSLRVSAICGAVSVLVLFVAGGFILGLFGPKYASQATVAVEILAIGVFPETIRTHFVAVRQLNRRIGPALPVVWGGAALEVAGGLAGATVVGTLTGVAVGWLLAICIESSVMAPDVWRMVAPVDRGSGDAAEPLAPSGGG
jgi:O-antigen/teichoic acid export membrane protein